MDVAEIDVVRSGVGVGNGVVVDEEIGVEEVSLVEVAVEVGVGDGVEEGVGLGVGDELLVSTERVAELLLSEPSRLKFPAESQNLFDATEITPSVVLSAAGVKVAE